MSNLKTLSILSDSAAEEHWEQVVSIFMPLTLCYG